MKWLNPDWEPSIGWTPEDRLELVSACCELIQRDVYKHEYSKPGRPNFTSIQAVIYEPSSVLEPIRQSCLELLQLARRERADAARWVEKR